MRNIAIFGMDGSGKSTLARAIKTLEPSYTVCPMAESLRLEIAAQGKYTLEELWEKPTPPHIRDVLVNWASENGRNNDPNYWIKKWTSLNLVKRGLTSPFKPVVIDDTRYLNEFYHFWDSGFLTVYLDVEIPPEFTARGNYWVELPMISNLVEITLPSKGMSPEQMAAILLGHAYQEHSPVYSCRYDT